NANWKSCVAYLMTAPNLLSPAISASPRIQFTRTSNDCAESSGWPIELGLFCISWRNLFVSLPRPKAPCHQFVAFATRDSAIGVIELPLRLAHAPGRLFLTHLVQFQYKPISQHTKLVQNQPQRTAF